MYIIVKNLNPGTTMDELEKFVLPAARQRFYEPKGTIRALKIIDLVNKKGRTIERHGLIRVDSDALEKRMIKSLNGKSLGETKVSVNTYTIRHWSVDPRSFSGLPQLGMWTNSQMDRRASDRRRKDLRMVAISEKTFTSHHAKPALARAVLSRTA